jgi:hypothetical protein
MKKSSVKKAQTLYHRDQPVNAMPARDTPAENKTSRQSLTAQWQAWNEKSVECTIEKGRLIKRGQEELKEGWAAWVKDDLHLSVWSAGLYIQIADNPIISDRMHWKHLPVDYRTLYELSLIRDQKTLLEKITEGNVHAGLGRAEAVKLKHKFLDKPARPALPMPDMPDALQLLVNVVRYFLSDKDWRAYTHQNKRPDELPSKDEIESALEFVESKRLKKRGAR